MLFNSFSYAIFLPAVFALYWLLKDRCRWILLIAASYFFYMCSGLKYTFIIFGVTVLSYVSAILIERDNDGKTKKAILTVTVAVCMGILFFFKYFNFFSSTWNRFLCLMGIQRDAFALNIILPVGISFYTFQTMSYVIDVYRGVTKAEHHFGKYAAFVSFFPQLVAGPIERSNNLLAQINHVHTFCYEQAMCGVKLMLWGYYKKLVIADVLSAYVQTVYDNPYEFKGFALIIASVFFTLQIYCDFSGYSDIAIGTAKLFGIDLITNFRSPYFAKSIKEFWKRWHISLSAWFRDYVYIPLGGNRVSNMRCYGNLMITFLASGLWHGASWNFVIWGGIHGAAQITENVLFGRVKESKKVFFRVLQTAVVFGFCTFAWIFFVANSLDDALYVIGNCLEGIAQPAVYLRDGFTDIGFSKAMLMIVGVCVCMMAGYDYTFLKEDFTKGITEKNKCMQWIFYIVIGLIIVFFSKKGVAAEFIYFQF